MSLLLTVGVLALAAVAACVAFGCMAAWACTKCLVRLRLRLWLMSAPSCSTEPFIGGGTRTIPLLPKLKDVFAPSLRRKDDVERSRCPERGGFVRRTDVYIEIVADESAEIFDDLYVGLRAGGALRKQRRGETLTTEEREALGRWQRLSTWRKALAIGGFALGTFGLGFTLGGLIFGRWRKA